ncbi:dTDP-4-dehydrorhamnose reductase [Halobellus ordinarius]|uniref:dTDP-4-dehydrorhamnose reductase n=1 Tax=Halobellus ordinarius TaxID=3075120 RepID=UPI0028800FD1|nr:dTDP-4-dehydrorhamnose reductase [Halobellus sp. ZY16]
MRLLVVGANGLLGSNVVDAGQQRGWDVCGTYHSTRPAFDVPLAQFDLGDYEEFGNLLEEYEPDVVVNCAAMTDVDGCERDPERAQLLNGDAADGLAAHCDDKEVEFVHLSTDYVFDGTARDPYTEEATPNPVQAYGESKLAGERAVRRESETALLARLSFVWGIHRGTGELTGFPAWVRDQLRSGEAVPLFADQWVTPTRAGQAAETLLDLLAREEGGLYHVACASCVTPYEFGTVIAEEMGADPELLQESSMADVDRAATRPTYSCLDVGNVEEVLDRAQPTVREDVASAWNAVQ